jgi:outer membrane protein assembly factor BamA
MKAYVRQHGNARWFSAVRIPLATYSLSGRDTTKWLNRVLRSIGEAPVLYDSLSTRRSMEDLQMQLVNMGYLRASVDAMTKSRKKTIDVTYLLHPGKPYTIRKVDYVIEDSMINSLLRLDDPSQRGLKSGMRFSVENLDGERKRITNELNNLGYYRFNKEYIMFEADSVANSQEIDVVLVLRKQRDNKGHELSHQRYAVRDVQFSSGDPEDSVLHLREGVLQRNT